MIIGFFCDTNSITDSVFLEPIASWLLTFLGGHSDWRSKAAVEVEKLLASSSSSPTQPLSARLATIPLEVWEAETPVLDALIRETTRVAQPHTAMRRNVGPDLYIDNKLVPSGAYVIYPFSDVHLDPELYPDPWKFDPGRKEPDHVPFSYVGWGGGTCFASILAVRLSTDNVNRLFETGKTTCLGTRLAKVELKLVTAMFVLGFEHSVLNASGEPMYPLPTPNWNDILLCRPPQGSFSLGYSRTSVAL